MSYSIYNINNLDIESIIIDDIYEIKDNNNKKILIETPYVEIYKIETKNKYELNLYLIIDDELINFFNKLDDYIIKFLKNKNYNGIYIKNYGIDKNINKKVLKLKLYNYSNKKTYIFIDKYTTSLNNIFCLSTIKLIFELNKLTINNNNSFLNIMVHQITN